MRRIQQTLMGWMLIATIVMMASSLQASEEFLIRRLGSKGDGIKGITPTAINNKGQIVGLGKTPTGEEHAFLWEKGVITDLGTLGGNYSIARDINKRGKVVGSSRTILGEEHAFIWEDGVMIDLGIGSLTGGFGSVATNINERGQVVGNSYGEDVSRAFLWENGVMTDLGDAYVAWFDAINERGQVVGTGATASGDAHALLWEKGMTTDLGTLGGAVSSALGINERGQVVGSSRTASDEYHAFLWENGTMADLGTSGDVFANNRGQVVLVVQSSSGSSHSLLWENGVVTDLGALDGMENTVAEDINDLGQVVGYCYRTLFGNARAFLWENGTMIDLGTLGGDSQAYAINERGQIVGTDSKSGDPNTPRRGLRAVLWVRK